MIGKKPTPLSLEELWDLEEQFTAVVGRPTGAKITQPAAPPAQGGGVSLNASVKSTVIHQEKLTVSKKGRDAGTGEITRKRDSTSGEITRNNGAPAGEVRRKVASAGKLSSAGKTKSKI